MQAINITIRKATAADIPAVYSLIKEFAAFQKTPEKVVITPEQMKGDKDLFQCNVAETADKKIIGFASYFFAYYSWSGKAVYLDDLYVQPAYRKQGIGKKLLRHVFSLAKETHCKKVRWQVSKWNNAAIEFYKSMGASIDEVEINCDYPLQ
ncbi:MAG: GNAT family N-acetyltransferase [Ferruginibacter sp.]